MKTQSRSAFLILFAAVLFLLACNMGGVAGGAPTPTLIVLPTLAPEGGQPPDSAAGLDAPSVANGVPGDAREAIIQAYSNLKTAYPFRLTETDTGIGDSKTVRVVDFAAAHETHSRWTSPFGNGELIETGGKYYWFKDGQWTETTDAPDEASSEVDLADYLANDVLVGASLVGPEVVNGVETLAYTCQLSVPGQVIDNCQTWIGPTSVLPYQAVVEYTVSSYHVKMVLTYEYGLEVNIAPPV